MNSINKNRIQKELAMFAASPPTGISCSTDDNLEQLTAQILGAPGTPYDGGVFHLEIQIPPRYPFDPPRVRFITPIYHPNIDTSGRICLDTLKLPPKGTWRPCLNLSTVLMMIRVLMAEPGSEDPLMTDIWQEFKYDYSTYTEKAKHWTKLHAMETTAPTKPVPITTDTTESSETSPKKETADKKSDCEGESDKSCKKSDSVPQPKVSSKLKVKQREGLQDVSNKLKRIRRDDLD